MTMVVKTESKTARPPRIAYDADVYGWVHEQVAMLRAGRFEDLDVANIVEELESVGRAEFNELSSALAVVIQHVLKWDHQPARRSRSWQLSVREHRRRATRSLADNPSLRPRIAEAVLRSYEDGRDRALAETKLADQSLPATCPYTFDEIMTRDLELELERKPRRTRAR
jgi:Domain of unknown function DUF29